MTFAQISTYCHLTVYPEVLMSQQRSTLNQISDAFSTTHDKSLMPRRARCPAHVGSIFNECCHCHCHLHTSCVQGGTSIRVSFMVTPSYVWCSRRHSHTSCVEETPSYVRYSRWHFHTLCVQGETFIRLVFKVTHSYARFKVRLSYVVYSL